MARYKVEPYVVAADVYAVSPHTGRGGWTWYTGSAGWMYRLITESLLGLRLEVDRLHVAPCLPRDGRASRCITGTARRCITSPSCQSGEASLTIDGEVRPDGSIPLVDDRRDHAVELKLGQPL